MISHTIKEQREQRGWSHQVLATKLHLNKKIVADWEMGFSVPTIYNLVELAKVLGVTADHLLGLSDDLAARLDLVAEKDRHTLEGIIQVFINAGQEEQNKNHYK